jgi:hypothetical protein
LLLGSRVANVRTFLLWRRSLQKRAEDVALALCDLLEPVLATPPEVRVLETPTASLVFLEQPVKGMKRPFFEQDADRWAFAIDYPVDAGGPAAKHPLLDLCRQLEEDRGSLLDELSPPFSVMWRDRRGDIRVQNDGLGYAQLFEYDDGSRWALTNRISALSALGLPLVPAPEEWAVRATIGWFPLRLTGFRHVRFLGPSTQLMVGKSVQRTTRDVLRRWIGAECLPEADCQELARSALFDRIQVAIPQWEKPWAALSGGHDTRAVVATLRAAGADFSVRVHGYGDGPDVVIARELARRAGLNLKVRENPGVPPGDASGLRRSISLALLCQTGHTDTRVHKSFWARQNGFNGGRLRVVGQHGEIGRGYYAKVTQGRDLNDDQYDGALLRTLLAGMPPFLRHELRDYVRETVRTACGQADEYDLTGHDRLDFFYLYERTRRWASGTLNTQDGLAIAPFLSPRFVHAVFSFRMSKERNPFHGYIVARYAPDWADVPYADELASSPAWAGREVRPWGKKGSASAVYWQTIGKPLIEEAFDGGGWWTEVFDPSLARKSWDQAPDMLAITYLLPHALEASTAH